MRLKTFGFLCLALVVVAGIVFVERRLGPDDEGGYTQADLLVYTVVVGGGEARAAAAAADDPGPVASEPESHLPVPPDPPRPPPAEISYRIMPGDTLGAIVRDHLGSAAPEFIRRVVDRNRLRDPDDIRPGDDLIIPVERYERHPANGRQSLRDLSQRYYGAPNRTAPLRKVNESLPASDTAPLPAGRLIWIPR